MRQIFDQRWNPIHRKNTTGQCNARCPRLWKGLKMHRDLFHRGLGQTPIRGDLAAKMLNMVAPTWSPPSAYSHVWPQ